MSLRKTALAPGQLLHSVQHGEKLPRQGKGKLPRCCTKGNPPLKVAPGQRKAHVNSYKHQTVHRGKVDPGVSELPWGNELSRDHVNRPQITVSLQATRQFSPKVAHKSRDQEKITAIY